MFYLRFGVGIYLPLKNPMFCMGCGVLLIFADGDQLTEIQGRHGYHVIIRPRVIRRCSNHVIQHGDLLVRTPLGLTRAVDQSKSEAALVIFHFDAHVINPLWPIIFAWLLSTPQTHHADLGGII